MQQHPLWIRNGQPALILAPMEGVTDAPMRAILSEIGGFTHCVSEFLRISQDVPGVRYFQEHTPELKTGVATKAGLPVQIQLLGGDAEMLAQGALQAIRAGAHSIDLNFGCPAPTVNRHDGGATLLKFPERIREIVGTVRKAVPREFPVSAKFRLGWDSMDPIHLNAEMAAEGGADWITIHGRTKLQGYIPPAYWGPIGQVRKRLAPIPVVANGEIWNLDDFKRCRDETGSEHFMIGRGAVADPYLAQRIGREMGIWTREAGEIGTRREEWLPLLERFAEVSLEMTDYPKYIPARIKQWVRMAHRQKPNDWFEDLKRMTTLEEMFAYMRGQAPTERVLPDTSDAVATV